MVILFCHKYDHTLVIIWRDSSLANVHCTVFGPYYVQSLAKVLPEYWHSIAIVLLTSFHHKLGTILWHKLCAILWQDSGHNMAQKTVQVYIC